MMPKKEMNKQTSQFVVSFSFNSLSMAFSSWLTRSRLSSRTISAFLRPTSRQLHSTAKPTGESSVISPEKGHRRFPNWLTSSLLPLAIAASATSFALLDQSHPSISESSSSALDSRFVDFINCLFNLKSRKVFKIVSFSLCRGITIGGKDSTETVVKGEYKQVPKELIDELKTILEVMQICIWFVYSSCF